MLVVVAAIFLLVEGTIVWSLLRYRRRRGDTTLPPQTHGHRGLEIVWTVIPTLVVLGLYVLSLETLGKVEAKAADPVEVDVHGYQWYWEFDLPQQGVHVSGIGTEPELVLPVKQPIRFRLETDNVIHSFFVPAFLFKRDLNPGTVNEFDVTIDEPGTYGGQCAGSGSAPSRRRSSRPGSTSNEPLGAQLPRAAPGRRPPRRPVRAHLRDRRSTSPPTTSPSGRPR
jgi:cytochrome c oxidase subunit 2